MVGRTAITFRSLELWSQRPPRVTPSDFENVASRFYMRFDVDDHMRRNALGDAVEDDR